MENVKLLGTWSSPFYYRVKWGLELKGITYEYIEEDIRNKSPMLLQYNPVHKKVPVLVHNGKPICESLIILEYLEETCPDPHPILPKDPYERAQSRFWAKYADEKCVVFWEHFLATGENQAKLKADCVDILRTIEEQCQLEKSKFIAGEKIGLADILLGNMIYFQEVLQDIMEVILFEASSFPSLYKWFNKFKEDPIIKNHLPDQERLFVHMKNLRQRLKEAATK